MPPDPPERRFATDFGDEGSALTVAPLALVHPPSWGAQASRDDAPLGRLTVYLEPLAPSSASIALHLIGAALDPATRDRLGQIIRQGVERGLRADAEDALEPGAPIPVRVTTLGAERDGARTTYTRRPVHDPEAEERLVLDLFAVALDAHTLFASVVASEADWDDAVSAFALVASTLTLSG